MASESGKRKDRRLFILQYLINNTDDEHRVSQQELADLCAESGHGSDRHLINNDINILCSYGFDVISTMEGRKKYYNYGCREFDIAELRTLIDAVESSVFISPRKTECLIQKIAGISSCHDAEKLRASVYAGKIAKAENNHIFLIIDVINQAINTGRKISFQHCCYDGNRKKVMRNNGEIYTVSPYLTIWKNDRYYLVGWADNRSDIALQSVEIKQAECSPIRERRLCAVASKLPGGSPSSFRIDLSNHTFFVRGRMPITGNVYRWTTSL